MAGLLLKILKAFLYPKACGSEVCDVQAAQNTQRQGAREIGERRRTYAVRRSETIERNEAYDRFQQPVASSLDGRQTRSTIHPSYERSRWRLETKRPWRLRRALRIYAAA
jgi:hypothetical protein